MSAKKDFNKVNRHGISPLFTAVENGDYGLVRAMLSEGADINLKSGRRTGWSRLTREMAYAEGSTPLHVACLMGDTMMVSLLLSKNAQPGIRNSENKTPLDYALQSLSYYSERYRQKKSGTKKSLKMAAEIGEYERIIDLMVAKGAKPALFSLPPKFTLGK